jgi:DHA1 family bicyclomycin/chloramphenicol resistance-like MFS transporter
VPRLRLIVLLGALSMCGPLSIDFYLPGLPAMARDLDAQPWAAQLTMTACMIGLGAGQILVGPVSDQLGRRGPLLGGLAIFTLMSLLCAIAPTVWALMALRLVQGVAGATGIVLSGAIVRDMTEGTASARLFAALLTAGALAPVLAPLAGGQLLHFADWRGSFLAMAGIGVVLLIAAAALLPETLAPQRRHGGGLDTSRRAFAVLSRDRAFVGLVACTALSFSALGIYLGGSSFVLEDIHGLSPQLYSVVFATNAAGIAVASQLSRRLVDRLGSATLLRAGVVCSALGGTGVLVVVLADAPLGALLVSLFLVVSAIGLVRPNAMALALGPHPERAGSAAGIIGAAQFLFGAALLPIAGAGGTSDALPMALAMCAVACAAPLVLVASGALHGQRRPAPAQATP